MITVLGRRNSANVQKVMWTLGELGIDYRREDIGGSFGYPADYPNPNQVVPTLMDDDLTVWESNACVRYLARTYGQGSLWPTDPKALALADQWMEWQRSDFSTAFFPSFMGKVRQGRPDNELPLGALNESYRQLDDHLAGTQFVAGESMTMGDIVIGTLTYRYMTMEIERPELPSVTAWYERLTGREAYQRHVMIWFGRNPEEWALEEQRNAGIQ